MEEKHHDFMKVAIQLAMEGMLNDSGGPFGAIVVKNGEIIGRGSNSVTSLNDPTAHAEVMAIRQACQALGSFQLSDCYIYTSCEPCPMCMGAIYWARPAKVYYACTRQDAAAFGFDDDFIYKELTLPQAERKIPLFQYQRKEAIKLFRHWKEKSDKVEY